MGVATDILYILYCILYSMSCTNVHVCICVYVLYSIYGRVDCALHKEFLNHQNVYVHVHVLTCTLWKYTLFIYRYSHAGMCIEHMDACSPVHKLYVYYTI